MNCTCNINLKNIIALFLLIFTISMSIFAYVDYDNASKFIDFTILIHIVFLTAFSVIFILLFESIRIIVDTFIMIASISITILLAILFHQKYTMIPNILLSMLTFIPFIRRIYEFYNQKTNIIHLIPDEKYYENCAICLDELISQTSIIKLSCDHRYHKICYQQWHGSCPQCRKDTTEIIEEHLNI